MSDNWIRKALVFAVIVLFVGASFVPGISGDLMNKKRNIPYSSIKLEGFSSQNNNFEEEIHEYSAADEEIPSSQKEEILDKYASLSMYFTENKGQFHEDVLFQTQADGATVYLCNDRIVSVFTIPNSVESPSTMNSQGLSGFEFERLNRSFDTSFVTTSFVDSSDEAAVVGMGQRGHYNNYFIGNDSDRWFTDVPNFESVYYYDIYPGVDLQYYFDGDGLKYDFIVSPGADPSCIKVKYSDAEKLVINEEGDLNVHSKDIDIYERKPLIYQMFNGEKQEVDGGFIKINSDTFGFKIDESYNLVSPLIIDPGLAYSTYLGGTNSDVGWGVAVDGSGCAYITGYIASSDFPTVNAYDDSFNGDWDVFVVKFSSSGDSLVYSTYLGGTSYDIGFGGVAVDGSGCAYITGYTQSSDFPTVNAYDDSYNDGYDVFVVKFSSSGDSLVYSTYLGGTSYDVGRGVAMDGSGCAYITGQTNSSDFPTVNAYDGSFNGDWDVFVVKFSSSGDSLVYSTYLGGTSYDIGFGGVAVDGSGCAYITGITNSSDFPTVNAYDDSYNGGYDGFVVKFSSSGDSLVYSTYLGGTSYDVGRGVAMDGSGCAYITGQTNSSDFPTVNAYDDSYNGGYSDVFVVKFSSSGDSLVYSTYLGGTGNDYGSGVAVDGSGCAYITGQTNSSDFPTVNAYDDSFNGGCDVFVVKFSSSGDSLVYSTYLGGTGTDVGWGVAVDGSGCAYITGLTYSSDFPTVNAYDGSYNDGGDVFVAKLSSDAGTIDVEPLDVTEITSNSAKLNARNIGTLSATGWFYYGLTDDINDAVGTECQYNINPGETFSQVVTDLASETTYHWWAYLTQQTLYFYDLDYGGTFKTLEGGGNQPDFIDGIDVSHYQNDAGEGAGWDYPYIYWDQVFDAGKKFAFVKATEGEGWTGDPDATDDYFEENMNEGFDAGMLVGAYHLARPDLNPDAAVDEADWFIHVAGDYIADDGYLRPFLDLGYDGGLTPSQLTDWVIDWVAEVEKWTCVQPLIYVSPLWADAYLENRVAESASDLFVADYTANPPRTSHWSTWRFWQHTETGSCTGIYGNVDLDFFNGDESRLNDFVITAGLNKPKITLFIEDAPLDHGVIWKEAGDYIDIVADIYNPVADNFQPCVTIMFRDEQLPDNSLVKCFIRNDFTDTDEIDKTVYCIQNGNSFEYYFDSPIHPDQRRQVVFRVKIPDDAPGHSNLNRNIKGELSVGYRIIDNGQDHYRVPNHAMNIIVTNRHLLVEKYGDDSNKVKELLGYLYDVASGDQQGEKYCVVYYVDHYDEGFKDWDNTNIDYGLEENEINAVANSIDNYIENWIGKSHSSYILIIGDDRIVPHYRVNNVHYTNTDETEGQYAISVVNIDSQATLVALMNNYFVSDNIYGDTDDVGIDEGKLEIVVSRIVGIDIHNLMDFLERGYSTYSENDNAVVASQTEKKWLFKKINNKPYLSHDAVLEIQKKWVIPDLDELNDQEWTTDDLKIALRKGFKIFAYMAHASWNSYSPYPDDMIGATEISDVNNNGCFSDNDPFVANDGCRLGVFSFAPSDSISMAAALVNNGVVGMFGPSGLTYSTYAGIWYGDKFTTDFFKQLNTEDDPDTKEVGKAFIDAKKNYDKGVRWNGKDKKTMLEFILYGVPWVKLRSAFPSKAAIEKPDCTVDISNPILLPDGNYSRIIEINIESYNVTNYGDFDLIIINGSSLYGEDLKPLVPYISTIVLLPNNANISEINILENTSNSIGTFNIPSSAPDPENPARVIFSNQTDVIGFYPSSIFWLDNTSFNDYNSTIINFAPIQYNPQTNETILYNFTKLEIIYQALTPIFIHSLQINDTFSIGNQISGSILCENVGAETLSGLRLNLSIENIITGSSLFNLSSPFNLDGGESKEVSAVINELVPSGGGYLAKVEIIDSNDTVLTDSTKDIFISSGKIVEFDCPENSDPSDPVIFSILFRNDNVSYVNASGFISIYDSFYRNVAELTSNISNIPSGSSEYINVTWNTTSISSDHYTISAMVNASSENYRTSNKLLIINPEIILVDDSYNSSTPGWQYDHFDLIQDGIDAVAENGTIYVFNGTYYENVVVDKSLMLLGENADSTILETNTTDFDYGLKILAPNVTMYSFTVTGAQSQKTTRNVHFMSQIFSSTTGKAGPYEIFSIDADSDNTVLSQCKIMNCEGIIRIESSGNRIDNSTFTDTYELYFLFGSNNIVENCSFVNNSLGLEFSRSSNNLLLNNTFVDSGILIGGINLSHYLHNITDNTVNNKPLIYIKNEIQGSLDDVDAGQIILANCSMYDISNTSIDNTSCGIELAYCNNINVSLNLFKYNIIGIMTCFSDYNTISDNIISNNQDAIYSPEICSNNVISDNQITSNIVGIELYDSDNNSIYHNNFISNNQHAYDDKNNTWDNGYPSGGNYWDDYTGMDADGDGIGDTPYNISGGSNQDNYPFTNPYGWLIDIDVNQSTFDRGFPIRHAIDGDWGAAQNFTPTLDTLTRVDIYLRKFGTPEFNLTVELREDHPQGTLIDTIVFTPGEVASSWQWLNIDFDDVNVGAGSDIFIVLPPAPSGVTTSFGYEWGYAFGNHCDDGSFWFTRDGGGLWRDLPTMYEFVFRTYGYS